MRIAPVGLFLHKDPEYAFQVGSEAAAITYGHPTGYLSTGAICGYILGVFYRINALPKEWVNNIELKALIVDMDNKLFNTANERNTNKNINTETNKIPKISRFLRA